MRRYSSAERPGVRKFSSAALLTTVVTVRRQCRCVEMETIVRLDLVKLAGWKNCKHFTSWSIVDIRKCEVRRRRKRQAQSNRRSTHIGITM